MKNRVLPAYGGLTAAIVITTTMDATGYAAFSALPLFPLAALFWAVQRFSTTEIGLTWGRASDYPVALAYPCLVLGVMALLAYLLGATDTSGADWNKATLNIVLMSTTGILVGMLTEEGFFRGWLWAALKRSGKTDKHVLVWTTLAFTAWHVSAITLDTGFDVPANEVPVYLVNATIIGGVFGILRMVSGSIVVPSVCHAVWNGLDYPLYGFGERAGALGIEQTHIFGPEVGIVGIGLNLLFIAILWRKYATPVADKCASIH